MKFCPECGYKLTGTPKFCPECGAKKPVPQTADSWVCPQCGSQAIGKFCPECGTKTEGMKFCPNCGKKLM